MALTSSGEISLAGSTSGRSIALEFGRGATSTLSLSQLYRNGGIVPSNNTNVPTSGTISFSNFYGATNRVSATVTYNSSQSNLLFIVSSVPGYVAGATDIIVNINAPVTISAAGYGAALTVGTFNSGDTIRINNAGTIQGYGGKGGGEYGSVGNYFYKSDGGAGGNAIDLTGTNASVTIVNTTAVTIKVYPNTSDVIDEGTANAAVNLAPYSSVQLVSQDTQDWYRNY